MKDLTVQGRDINNVVKEFNSHILKAAQETIPRGCRRNYKPYWSPELQQLEDDLSQAREEAETNPSPETNLKLQQAKAKFLKGKIQEKRYEMNFNLGQVGFGLEFSVIQIC